MEKKIIKRSRWNATDVAMLKYAMYRGLKYKHAAQVIDRSLSSTTMMGSLIRQYEENRYNPKSKIFKIIGQGLKLEYQVRSGLAPDQKAYWDKKISAINGITYTDIAPQASEEPQKPVEKKETVPTGTGVVEEEIELISVSVKVNFATVLKLLKAWEQHVK